MTIDELIQRSGGQTVPVEDRVQIKEITKLNKNIQTLIDRVDKSSTEDKDSNKKLSDKIKQLAEQVVKKPADKIAPRLTTPVTKAKDKKDETSTKVDRLERNFGDMMKSMTKKGPFASLQAKQMAGTVDPSKQKPGGKEGEDAGGIFAKLLAGAFAAYFIKENWDEIKKIMGPVFKSLKTAIVNAIDAGMASLFGDAVKEVKQKIKDVTDKLGMDIDPENLSLGMAAAGVAGAYGLYRGGKAALGAGVRGAGRLAMGAAGAVGATGIGVGKRIAAGLGLGSAKEEVDAEKQTKKDQAAERKAKADKLREERRLQRTQQAKIEPTLEKPKVEAKPQPKPLLDEPLKKEPASVPGETKETPEQREARERATRKAQDEQRAKMEADRKKSQKTIDDVSSRRKPSMADRLKQGANAAKGKMGKFGKVALAGLRKAGPLAALAFGAYDTAKAATQAEEVLGIEGRKATVGERVAAGIGGLGEGLSFGLVSREKIAQGIAGSTKLGQSAATGERKDLDKGKVIQATEQKATGERKDVDREKVVQAIEQKAMDEKKRREINAEISRNKIEMHKMLRDGKKEQAMELARETVKLQDKLKAAERIQQPGQTVYRESQENSELKMKTAAGSPFQGMSNMIQNVFNSQNQTNVQSLPSATPRGISSSLERYLEKVR